MASQLLKLNQVKTEFVVIGAKRQIQQCIDVHNFLGDAIGVLSWLDEESGRGTGPAAVYEPSCAKGVPNNLLSYQEYWKKLAISKKIICNLTFIAPDNIQNWLL